MSPTVPRRRLPSPATRSRGFGLLQALLLVVLIGGAVSAGLVLLRSEAPPRQSAQQEQALRWADEALVAYAAANARLPCAVDSPTGTACVGPGQKGWLPVRALEALRPGGAGPLPPLRYVVYRGAGDADLAVASNTYSPYRWDAASRTLDPINGLDFCAKIAEASRQSAGGVQSGLARTLDAGGAPLNIAYGVVAAGPTPGNGGGRFDGLNQDGTAAVEAPSRATSGDYDDRTRVRDFNTLAQTLGCGFADAADPQSVALAATDMLGMVVDVNDEVVEQAAGNVDDTQEAVVMAGVSVAFAGLNVALSAASISNSASTLGTASGQLSGAIASCVVLVGCALIPVYTAAVIAGGIAVGLASSATAAAAVALGLSSAALADTIVARDMAKVAEGSLGGNVAQAAANVCLAAEGGFVTQVADANGVLQTVDPPVWRDGLKQELERAEAELASRQADRQALTDRLAALEVPRPSPLIEYDERPTQLLGEDDDDYAQRVRDWQEQQYAYERELLVKLEAIRVAKRAQFAWDRAKGELDAANKTLADMQTAVATLTDDVNACNASPPTDIVGIRVCENRRWALAQRRDCTGLTAAQRADHQCIPLQTTYRDQVVQQVAAAEAAYRDAEIAADTTASPPIRRYIAFSPSFVCDLIPSICNRLIIRFQSGSDTRETYAVIHLRWLYSDSQVQTQQQVVDEARAKYTEVKAQCDLLRSLSLGGSPQSPDPPPVWAGADAIMQAANCRGATGSIQPATCPSSP